MPARPDDLELAQDLRSIADRVERVACPMTGLTAYDVHRLHFAAMVLENLSESNQQFYEVMMQEMEHSLDPRPLLAVAAAATQDQELARVVLDLYDEGTP